MYNTAVAYFSGKGVTHSFEKAAEYFQKAADKGFTAAQVSSVFSLIIIIQ